MKAFRQYAPVVVFVYNRPEHTKKMLEALNLLKEAVNTDIYIYADAPKNEKSVLKVSEVDKVINSFLKISKFKNTYYYKKDKNYGLAKSIIEGVSSVIEQYEKVIVLEDDLIVNNDFLDYMNRALEYYLCNDSIWAISGYTFPLKALETYQEDVYLSGRGCSWGWATWKNRWDKVDWEFKDYTKFKFNIVDRIKFSRWGRDLPFLADAYYYGEVHSWAIRWCYGAFKNNMLTVYPKYSRVQNIGTDGSGTNFKNSETKYETSLYTDDVKCEFCFPEVSKTIRKEFARKYLTDFQLIKSEIRWLLVRLGLLRI